MKNNNMNKIFNNDSITIFTDGSISKQHTGETIGCAGAILVETNNGVCSDSIHTKIIRHTTNNNTEIKSIKLGIGAALQYMINTNKNIPINLFSDSKICIYGLREWVYNWVKSNIDGVLHSSSGTPVSNQEVFKDIIMTIISNNLRINLFHQKGHVNINSDKSITNALRVFNESNMCKLNDIEFMKTISKYNDLVDVVTKEKLFEYVNNNSIEYSNQPKVPFIYDISVLDMSKYSRLIKY